MHTDSQMSKSIDPREVEYYSALAQTWWDRKGPFWPLHRLNELRIKYIVDQIRHYYSVDRVSSMPLAGLGCLDIGCGGGILSESLARHGGTVHGIDVVEKNIGIANSHARENGLDIDYSYTTVEALAAGGNQYELVFNMEVVEHVVDVKQFMSSCCKLVKPGGLMFISTLNRNWYSYIAAILGAEYILRWLPKGTHQWGKFLKPAELKSMLRANQLDCVAETGVAVNPLTRGFSLTDKMWVNYMLVAKNNGNISAMRR